MNSDFLGTESSPQQQNEPSELYGTPCVESEDVKNWATPTTRDYKDASNHRARSPSKNGVWERNNSLPTQVGMTENYSGALNPRWVETLMGLPVGWTMPSANLEPPPQRTTEIKNTKSTEIKKNKTKKSQHLDGLQGLFEDED
jgi:hypothetical protein